MPITSASEAFDELLRRIELNPTRVTLASQRYNAVKDTIERALPGKTVRQIGSFQRKTKIRPLDLSDKLDVDATVSFGTFQRYALPGQGVTPSSALQTVRNALSSNDTYRVMPQATDHPVIRLEYADDMSIELAPVFEDLTGQHPHGSGEPTCYIVGSSPNSWRAADYDYDARVVSTMNGLSQNKLVPAIKLVKAYFRTREVPLKSFHTEVLVANIVPMIVADWNAKNYQYGYHHVLAGFLSRAGNVVAHPVALQGSFSPPTDSGLDAATLLKVGEFLAKRAEAAWSLCKNKSGLDAVAEWRTFFGDPFPA